MKIRLTLFFLLASLVARPCGWAPASDHYFYHNIFDQTNIASEAYYPFLRDDTGIFFENDGQVYDQGNIMLWKEILTGWSLEDIRKVLESDTQADFEKHWKNHKTALDLQSKQYLQFARKCSKAFEHRTNYSWDYDAIRKTGSADVAPLLEEGNVLFSKETNQQLKMRYGYQIVRILHYSQQYKEAIAFFKEKLELLGTKNEIYYYALDQAAGCYYNLGDTEKAAHMFLKVFNNSLDRKKSAFLSYRFCTDHGAEGKTYFEGAEDKAAFILMRSIRSFSDGIAGLRELYALDPANEKVELLFMRELNNVERELLPKHIGMQEGVLPVIVSEKSEVVNQLLDFAKKVNGTSKVTNKDFWKLSESYLHFLKGNIDLAKKSLTQVKSLRYKEQVQSLQQVYEVFSWKQIGLQQENYLADILSDEAFSGKSVESWDQDSLDRKFIILDYIGHLYYKSGNLAKAFLVHNRIENVERVGSLPLINDLLTFVNQADKNRFEKKLMLRAVSANKANGANEYLQVVKGHYYLQQGQPEIALPLLKQLSTGNSALSSYQTALDNYVSAKVFSNNIKECFECSEEEIMADSVYLASVFSFIKPSFNRAEMAINVLKLDSLTRDEKAWKRKLAHYLLANYYFNVSNTGYYRNVLHGHESNCCNYWYFPYTSENYMDAADRITRKSGYNLYGIDVHNRTYFGLANKAKHHYQQVLINSTDAELNARCLYMMAKCELNTFYNKDLEDSFYSYYEGNVEGKAGNYKESFKKLKNEYSKTKFYKMIIKECSFFRIYSSL